MMRNRRISTLLFSLLCALSLPAHASGPRWVTGLPYYSSEGKPVVWYTNSPQYFTDPGDLSPYVSHVAADALVKAAASVWNVSTANFTLLYGGSLAEHVSLANAYPTSTGIVFPDDVQSTSYLTSPIAVLYDSDGSITDLLLGAGASSPSSCRQNAVTESVDSISTAGLIQHAILILNGRCTGPAPEQQLQLQYQLMRAFGRVIGLSWSQTNDNVFTGTPTPTIQQAMHWPVMHPIDILCGLYTYQCMPQPFTLRDDDISGLGLLYPVGTVAPSIPGKIDTLYRANRLSGNITFPNGQGMQGVNVVVHRLEPYWDTPEAWETTSAVSGALFRRRSSTLINQILPSPTGNMGSFSAALEGFYDIFRTAIPQAWEPWQNLIVSTQPINPLYIGPHAVGPYDSGTVAPSGSSMQLTNYVTNPYAQARLNFKIADAASGCQTAQDGTEASPSAVPSTGWWNSNFCSYGHTTWSSLGVKAGRTLTLEVSALDQNSALTTTKARPVLGVWNSTDPLGTPPSLASSPEAFNSSVSGMTTLALQSSLSQQLRIGIMDQRGDGRPDFAYQARVLYADSVSPSSVPSKGGAITITGLGFRPGNTVTIDGVPASVTGWASNAITANAPTLHLGTAATVDVTVSDLVTGGSTTMTAALSYQAPQPELTLLSAPSGTVIAQISAPVPFTVKAIAADETSPMANLPISLSSTSGQVRFDSCNATACTLYTDASGKVSTLITPLAPGSSTLNATSTIGAVTADLNAIPHIQTVTALSPQLYLAQNAVLSWNPQVSLTDNATSATGIPVRWTPLSGPLTVNPATTLSGGNAIAQTTATAGPFISNSSASATVCAWNSICSNFTVTSVNDTALQISVLSEAQQAISATQTFTPVVLRIADAAGHPIAGANVTVHQTIQPWSVIPCPPQGRCPIPPAGNAATATLISGLDGTLTITPSEDASTPETILLAATTGSQGFLSLQLQKLP